MELIYTCTDMAFYNAQETAAALDAKAREQAARFASTLRASQI